MLGSATWYYLYLYLLKFRLKIHMLSMTFFSLFLSYKLVFNKSNSELAWIWAVVLVPWAGRRPVFWLHEFKMEQKLDSMFNWIIQCLIGSDLGQCLLEGQSKGLARSRIFKYHIFANGLSLSPTCAWLNISPKEDRLLLDKIQPACPAYEHHYIHHIRGIYIHAQKSRPMVRNFNLACYCVLLHNE